MACKQASLAEAEAEVVMLRREPRIISDRTRGGAKSPASSYIGDWHDVIGHHRYYGSSAIAGEPIVESRRGPRPRAVSTFGF